jgi:hypothetical protein
MKNAPGMPGAFLFVTVIPGRPKEEPGLHNHVPEYGFRARAKWRVPTEIVAEPYRSNAAFSAFRCGTSGLPITT